MGARHWFHLYADRECDERNVRERKKKEKKRRERRTRSIEYCCYRRCRRRPSRRFTSLYCSPRFRGVYACCSLCQGIHTYNALSSQSRTRFILRHCEGLLCPSGTLPIVAKKKVSLAKCTAQQPVRIIVHVVSFLRVAHKCRICTTQTSYCPTVVLPSDIFWLVTRGSENTPWQACNEMRGFKRERPRLVTWK